MVWSGMVWCAVVWCGIVLCSVVSYGLPWYGIILYSIKYKCTWYCIVLWCIKWYGIVRYGIVCHGVVWYGVTVCHTIPYCIIRQNAFPHNSLQYNGMVWFVIVLWSYTILHGIVFMVWHGVILYCVVLCDIGFCDMVSYCT